MNCYELIYALPGDVSKDVIDDVGNNIKSYITEHNGKIEGFDFWGLKKLAYPIRKVLEGNYFYLKFFLEPKFLLDLQVSIRINELILRHNFMKIEKDFSIRKKKFKKIDIEDKPKEELNS